MIIKNKSCIIGLALLFFSLFTNCQENENFKKIRPSVYMEGFGNGYFGSMNVDITLFGKNYTHYSLRTGTGYTYDGLCLLFEITTMTGYNRNHLELGIGTSQILYDDTLFFLRIGYRYQPYKKGLMFRLGFTPYCNFESLFDMKGYGGVSVGYTF